MAIKPALALVIAAAVGLANAQFFPPMRECTFKSYTSSDCTGDPVAPSVPHYASCWVGALESYSLEGPECYLLTVEGFGDKECGYPYVNVFSEAHPISRAGCYKFTTNPQSAFWFFVN
ncbi:hypothetical protein GGR58DRAFT_132590 [Xylaria digitata]|nr:hypothetical protein GGR58DRAFT_132590 [Xylaria digitata]